MSRAKFGASLEEVRALMTAAQEADVSFAAVLRVVAATGMRLVKCVRCGGEMWTSITAS